MGGASQRRPLRQMTTRSISPLHPPLPPSPMRQVWGFVRVLHRQLRQMTAKHSGAAAVLANSDPFF